jgi:hypothetical protein
MKNRKAKVEKDHDSDHEDDLTEITEESKQLAVAQVSKEEEIAR